MPKIRPMRPGAGEYQGLGQLATGCRGAGWLELNDQVKRVGASYKSQLGAATFRRSAIPSSHSVVSYALHRHHCYEQQAERGDDLSSHRFGHHRALAVNPELEHGAGQSLGRVYRLVYADSGNARPAEVGCGPSRGLP